MLQRDTAPGHMGHAYLCKGMACSGAGHQSLADLCCDAVSVQKANLPGGRTFSGSLKATSGFDPFSVAAKAWGRCREVTVPPTHSGAVSRNWRVALHVLLQKRDMLVPQGSLTALHSLGIIFFLMPNRYESQENDSAKTINKKVPVDTSGLVNAKLRQTDGPSVLLLE